MAMDFPNSPTNGSTYTPAGGPTYVYQSSVWLQVAGSVPSITDPYPFITAQMQLKSAAAGSVAVNSKVDGTGTNVATISNAGAIAGATLSASGAVSGASLSISGSATTGPHDVAGLLRVTTGGRILSADGAGSSQPSVSCWHTGRSTCYGMWNASNNTLGFGTCDGGGNPTATWGAISSGGFTLNGQMNATGSIVAGTGIYGNNGDCGIYPGGSGRVMQFAASWYFNWNSTNGTLQWVMSDGAAGWTLRNDRQFILPASSNGWKPGGGVWADTSDERIKTVLSSYDSSLDQIVALQPVRYTFKGNDTDVDGNRNHEADGKEYIGLVAQATELVMPEMVNKSEGYIDGEKVTDLRNLDTGPLIFALVNAVKELAAKVAALEAKG
jgi:Chaperone of endosialidase